MLSIVHTDQESKGADANHDAEDSSFIPLGQITNAVILRLSSDLPRIRCETSSTEWRGLENVSR